MMSQPSYSSRLSAPLARAACFPALHGKQRRKAGYWGFFSPGGIATAPGKSDLGWRDSGGPAALALTVMLDAVELLQLLSLDCPLPPEAEPLTSDMLSQRK